MTEKTEKITILGSFIWLVATLFFLYEFFLRTFVGTLAYQIISELHLSLEEFSLLGTAYFISYSLMQIPVGILCEKFGVKKIAVIAAFICALSIFLFANSTTFEMAFFSRLIMGFGSSFAFICLLVVTLDCFPRKYFGFFRRSDPTHRNCGTSSGCRSFDVFYGKHERIVARNGISGRLCWDSHSYFNDIFLKKETSSKRKEGCLLKEKH